MKKPAIFISTILVGSLLMAGCSNENKDGENSNKGSMEQSEHKESHFDYNDQKGWEFEAGDSQSPIDIDFSKVEQMKDSGKIELNYQEAVVSEVDNGHSIQINDTGTAVINGRTFELVQFHFHAKSEHTVNGQHFPIEIHFVNKAQDGRLAVIAVFFTEGKRNEGFQNVLDHIEAEGKTEDNDTIHIDVNSMIPVNKSYYHYLGSLTTPPLSENVEWYVMNNKIEASKQQIETFMNYYDSNNRSVQPLKDRVILEHKE